MFTKLISWCHPASGLKSDFSLSLSLYLCLCLSVCLSLWLQFYLQIQGRPYHLLSLSLRHSNWDRLQSLDHFNTLGDIALCMLHIWLCILCIMCLCVCVHVSKFVCVRVEGCQYACVCVALVIVNMYIMHKYWFYASPHYNTSPIVPNLTWADGLVCESVPAE